MTAKPKLDAAQVHQIDYLRREHGVDPSEVTILSNGEPWLNSKTRLRIAEASEFFESIESTFDKCFTEPASSPTRPGGVQVVHNTTVVRQGRPYTMPGIAMIGEKLWNGEEADAYDLSRSRSIANACDAAGFNPLRRPRSIPTQSQNEEADADAEAVEAALRVKDLRRIHVVARQVGLIRGLEERLYRGFLREFYQVDSSAAMDLMQRHLLINKMLAHGPAFVRDRRRETGDGR